MVTYEKIGNYVKKTYQTYEMIKLDDIDLKIAIHQSKIAELQALKQEIDNALNPEPETNQDPPPNNP